MKIGIPVYEGVDLLDVAGPYEMFKWVDESKALETLILSDDGGPVTSVTGVRFEAHASFAAAPVLDVLWVPGGLPASLSKTMSQPDSPCLAYLRHIPAAATWVCSVCEGALLLARAGLLDGHRATTHWAFVPCLKKFPAARVEPGYPRFVVSGNRLTGGISSGLDEALKLIELIFDEATAIDVQQTTQYFLQPPVHGSIPPASACCVSW